MTNIDALLSPYRGFNPVVETLVTAAEGAPLRRTDVLRATRRDLCPELPSPASWKMSAFVRSLTA